ncbi:MAG: glycosyltransferase family 4 protein [Candidatus Thorarchaeota archaeon]|jgi:glycosyltransferase involved in cell wall biosynthesis
MRICLSSYRGHPYGGGQGIYIHHLSKALCNLGHEVQLLSGPPHPNVIEAVKVHKLESLDLYGLNGRLPEKPLRVFTPLNFCEVVATLLGIFPEPFTFSVRAYGKLRSLLKRERIDVIHDNQCLGYGFLPMKQFNIPIVCTIHHPVTVDRDIDVGNAKGWWQKSKMVRWYSFLPMQTFVSRRMDRIISVSHSSADDTASAFKIAREKFRVVHNGVDISLFKKDESIQKEPNSLVVVGGHSPIKGLSYLLGAVRLLRNEMELKLTVVGGSPDGRYSSGLVKDYGLEDMVTFTGRVSHEELVRRYSASEVAVVPSLYEGFGFPAAEAMSCGVPVISTTAGALPEVVGPDGEAGMLVPPGDSHALAAAIRRLMTDDLLKRKMGVAARKRVEANFTWEEAAKKTVAVYEELLPDAHH